MTPGNLKTNTAAAPRPEPEWPTWQQRPHTIPRVILSTGRLDINAAFQSRPVKFLEDFVVRARRLFPTLSDRPGALGLMVKAPRNGRGQDWHDQSTGLDLLHWNALLNFRGLCLQALGTRPYLYTRPRSPFPIVIRDWPTWRYVEEGFGLWFDSTASELHLAREAHASAFLYAPHTPPVGIEGWGDLYADRPGPALMNWRKVQADDRHAFNEGMSVWRVRRRLSATPWLYTLTNDPRSNTQIPLDVLGHHHAIRRSVVCINPSEGLAAEIDDLFSEPLAPAKGGA